MHSKSWGTPTPIRIGQDGSQLAALRVASKDSGFLVFATTPSAKGEELHPGDVVLWAPYEYSKEAGDQMSDKRSGWVGLIRTKLKPEINPADPSFVVACPVRLKKRTAGVSSPDPFRKELRRRELLYLLRQQ
jgi:hypothetical protein